MHHEMFKGNYFEGIKLEIQIILNPQSYINDDFTHKISELSYKQAQMNKLSILSTTSGIQMLRSVLDG